MIDWATMDLPPVAVPALDRALRAERVHAVATTAYLKGLTPLAAARLLFEHWRVNHGDDPEWPAAPPAGPTRLLPTRPLFRRVQ